MTATSWLLSKTSLARHGEGQEGCASLQSRQAISESHEGAMRDDGKFDPCCSLSKHAGSMAHLSDAGDVLELRQRPQSPSLLARKSERAPEDFPVRARTGLSRFKSLRTEPNALLDTLRGERHEHILGGPADPHVAGGLAGARRVPPRPRAAIPALADIKRTLSPLRATSATAGIRVGLSMPYEGQFERLLTERCVVYRGGEVYPVVRDPNKGGGF